MFISPYSTTVGGKLKNVERIQNALAISYVDGDLSGMSNTDGRQSVLLELLGGKKFETDVPTFGHPINLNTVMDGIKVVVDQRTYANVPSENSRAGSATNVKNEREYNFMQNRGLLQIGWEKLGPDAFSNLGAIPMRVYCDWVARQVGVSRGLDDEKIKQMAILAAWFYLCQFSNHLDEQDYLPMIKAINRYLRYDFASIGRVVDGIGNVKGVIKKHIPNIAAFTEVLRTANISPRLNVVNQALLFEITAYSWIGGYNKEVAGIALEHPPTFILLCSAADSDRGYKDTVLARLMKEQRRLSSDVDNFQFNVKHLLEKCRGVERI